MTRRTAVQSTTEILLTTYIPLLELIVNEGRGGGGGGGGRERAIPAISILE